jgi:cellulose synthase (UDP-forming)
VPEPTFLLQVLPHFVDPQVAFVQAPQYYGNRDNIVSIGAAEAQRMFYELVCPGKNHFNAAFCVGTNVMFRRSAVQEIGGIYADSKSEDVWTSLKLHERGWRSVYLARTLAVGDAPESIEAYTKQQLRWATGGFEILLRANPFSRRRHLTMDQRIMYGITATHYLTGIAPGLLLLVPPMEIYLDLHPVDLGVSVWQWLAVYAGFYLMQIFLAFATLGSFRWQVLMLAAVSFPIYARAFFNALLQREQKWHVTGGTRKAASPFNFIIPQVLAFVFLLATSVVAVWQVVGQDVVTLGAAWNVTNTLIIGTFMVVAWREARRGRRPARSVDRRPARVPQVQEALS